MTSSSIVSSSSTNPERLVTAGNRLNSSPDRAFLVTPHLTRVYDFLPLCSTLGGGWPPLPLSPQCPARQWLGLVHRTEAKATHQVHDKIQLNGEVHDEDDTGPGVPGVGGHHHIWEAVFAEHYPQGPCPPVSAFSKDIPLSACPPPRPSPTLSSPGHSHPSWWP